jgi:hypothetical protein
MVWDLESKVTNYRFRVWDLGFGVWAVGFMNLD